MKKRIHPGKGTHQVLSKSAALQIFKHATHLREIGQFEEALMLARKLPDSPTRARLLVDILLASGTNKDLLQADHMARHWLKRQTKNPEPVEKLIEIQIVRREFRMALKTCDILQRRLPDKGAADYYRAVIHQLDGRLEQALPLYLKSVKTDNALKSDGSMTAAAALDVRATMILCETAFGRFASSRKEDKYLLLDSPGELELLRNRLLAWEKSGADECREAPEWEKLQAADAWYNLGSTVIGSYSSAKDAIACLDNAIRLNPDHIDARVNRLYALNYACGLSETEIMADHIFQGAWLDAGHGLTASPDGGESQKTQRDGAERIKIAYLSSDFYSHSVAYFIAPVVSNHDRKQFAVHLIHTGKQRDQVTERFKSEAEYFHPVAELNNNQLRHFIMQQGIDILIDLNGMTANHRLPVFAARSAPVQVSWLGYPNTTGLTHMDYRIVDAITDPPDYAQSLATEKLVYMPDTFSVYEPLEQLPPVSNLPCLETGMVTFGCFNHMAKINDELVHAWAKILTTVQRSRILLKNKALTYPEQQRRITEAFLALGIDSNRLTLMGTTASKIDHLACYHQVDISLDCFPYNGTTTNCEGLMMGVPIVSLAGKGHRSRVTATQLHAVGLDRLVAHDWDEYVDIAVRLASDESGLQQIRTNLRSTLLNSSLCDAANFTRELETRFKAMVSARNSEKALELDG